MYTKKRISLVLTLVLSVLFLCSCGTALHDALYDDDAKIVSPEDMHSYNNFSGGGSSETDYSSAFGSFSGKDTLWTITAEDGATLNVSYELTAEKGQLKLLLASADDVVAVLQEGTSAGEALLRLDEGEYRLMMVGKSTKGKTAVTLSQLEGCTAQKPD